MPRFAANISMMFNEVSFLERFARARASGFDGVEFLFPYEHPAADIADALKAATAPPAEADAAGDAPPAEGDS